MSLVLERKTRLYMNTAAHVDQAECKRVDPTIQMTSRVEFFYDSLL